MASGCILGTCPVCNDHIWEDEWDIIDDIIIHERCRHEYIKSKYHLSEQQFEKLVGINELRKEIDDTIQCLKNDTDFYMEKLTLLQKRLEEIINTKRNSRKEKS